MNFSLGENNNRAIKASAGSGKTFQLAVRYLALLFLEPKLDPAQIAAITFTRKAAGEIFDKIIDLLLKMEQEPALSAQCIQEGLLPAEFTKEAVPGLLKRLLLSRELQISTIDSFFVRIIQAFSPEFGLSGPVEMVDENSDPGEMDTLKKVIRKEKDALLPLLKEYAEDREDRNITETLKRFLDENYAFFLLYPEEEKWGNLPEEHDDLSAKERLHICDLLKIGMEHYNYPARLRQRLDELIEAAETEDPQMLSYFFRTAETPDGFRLLFGNKKGGYPLSAEICSGIRKLYHDLAVLDWRKKRARTKAAYKLLKLFDDLYSADIRAQGRLTFRDLPKLLSSLPEEKKLDLEYRIDTCTRHYMLDEFQDTSDQQWKFMDNLMSEAIQGTDQSFFMVGDIKQSLYQWRYGNPKLFDSICKKYSLEQRHSDRSFRSAPAVIGTVNRVFGHPEKLQERDAAAVGRMGFVCHTTAKEELSGYAALIQAPEEGENNKFDAVYRCLQKIDPLKRSLSAAILVRTNKEVEKWKQALRMRDSCLPVSTEGVVRPSESLACSLLFLLLRLAVHPGDKMARGALPLFCFRGKTFTAAEFSTLLQLPEAESWPDLSARLRNVIDEEGLTGAVSRFQHAFEGKLSAFDRERLAVAAAGARDFPGTADEYLALMDRAGGAESSAEKTIQIMTIHRSKGLEFDVVILPELGTLSAAGYARLCVEPMPENCEHFSPSWISYLPGSISRESLPALQEINERMESDSYYEKCCGLYVAMTRARRGLYLFVKDSPGKEGGKTFRADHLLRRALGEAGHEENVLFETGTPEWFRSVPVPEKKTEEPEDGLMLSRLRAIPAADETWLSPSEETDSGEDTPESRRRRENRFESSFSAQLGTRLHRVMESVEFLDSIEPEKMRQLCAEDEIGCEAWKIFRTLLSSSAICSALSRPAGPFQLWREREFLLKNSSGILVSGCFDRVLILPDSDGSIREAVISDYKSDALEHAEEFLERHSRQLSAYRHALSLMLELPEEKIRCEIIALRTGQVIPLDRFL